MIRLSGPRIGDAGSRVCITATNIGKGFSVIAVVNGKEIPVDVTIDPAEESAVICLVLPEADSGGVSITATNAGKGRGATHAIASL